MNLLFILFIYFYINDIYAFKIDIINSEIIKSEYPKFYRQLNNSINNYNKNDDEIMLFTLPISLSDLNNNICANKIIFNPSFYSFNNDNMNIIQSLNYKILLQKTIEYISIDKNEVYLINEENNLLINDIIDELKNKRLKYKLVDNIDFIKNINMYDINQKIIIDPLLDFRKSIKIIRDYKKYNNKIDYFHLYPITKEDYHLLNDISVYSFYNSIDKIEDFYISNINLFLDSYRSLDNKYINDEISIIKIINGTEFIVIKTFMLNNSKRIIEEIIKDILILNVNDRIDNETFQNILDDIDDDIIENSNIIMKNITSDECLDELKEYYKNDNQELLLIIGDDFCYNEIENYDISYHKLIWLFDYKNKYSIKNNIFKYGEYSSTKNYLLMKYVLLNEDIRNTLIINDDNEDTSIIEWFKIINLDTPEIYKLKDIDDCIDYIESNYKKDSFIVLNINDIKSIEEIIQNDNYTYYINSLKPYEIFYYNISNIIFSSIINYEKMIIEEILMETVNVITIFNNIKRNTYENYDFLLGYIRNTIFHTKYGIYQIDKYNNLYGNEYICKYYDEIICEEHDYYKSDITDGNYYKVGGLFNIEEYEDISLLLMYLKLIDGLNDGFNEKRYYPLIYYIDYNDPKDCIKKYNILSNTENIVLILIGTNSISYSIVPYINDEIVNFYIGITFDESCGVEYFNSGESGLGICWGIYHDILKYNFEYIGLLFDENGLINYVKYLPIFSKLLTINIIRYMELLTIKQQFENCINNPPCIIVNFLNIENSKIFYTKCEEEGIKFSYHGDITLYDIFLTENNVPDKDIGSITAIGNYFNGLIYYEESNENIDFLRFVNTAVDQYYNPTHFAQSLYTSFNIWKDGMTMSSSFNPIQIYTHNYFKQFSSPNGVIRLTYSNRINSIMFIASSNSKNDYFTIRSEYIFDNEFNAFPYYYLISNNYCEIVNYQVKNQTLNYITLGIILDGSNSQKNITNKLLYIIEEMIIEKNSELITVISLNTYLLKHTTEDDNKLSEIFINREMDIIFGCVNYYCYNKLLPYIIKSHQLFFTFYKPFKSNCSDNIFYFIQPEVNTIPEVLNYFNSINISNIYYLHDNNDDISIDTIALYYDEEILNYNNMNITYIQFNELDINTIEILITKRSTGIILNVYMEEFFEFLLMYPMIYKRNAITFFLNDFDYGTYGSDYQINFKAIIPKLCTESLYSINEYTENIINIVFKLALDALNKINYTINDDNYEEFVKDYINSIENTYIQLDKCEISCSNDHVISSTYIIGELSGNNINPVGKNKEIVKTICPIEDNKVYYELPNMYIVISICVLVASGIFDISFAAFVIYFRDTRVIKASSGNMLVYIIFSYMFCTYSIYAWYYFRYSDFICCFFTSVFYISICNLSSALIFKTWRIDKILHNSELKKITIKSSQVYLRIFASNLFHLLIDVIWYPIQHYSYLTEIIVKGSFYKTCKYDTIHSVIHFTFLFILFAYGLWESFKNSGIEGEFNDSRTLSLSILLMLYVSTYFFIIYNYVARDPPACIMLITVAIPITCLISEIFIFTKIFFDLKKHILKRFSAAVADGNVINIDISNTHSSTPVLSPRQILSVRGKVYSAKHRIST